MAANYPTIVHSSLWLMSMIAALRLAHAATRIKNLPIASAVIRGFAGIATVVRCATCVARITHPNEEHLTC